MLQQHQPRAELLRLESNGCYKSNSRAKCHRPAGVQAVGKSSSTPMGTIHQHCPAPALSIQQTSTDGHSSPGDIRARKGTADTWAHGCET